MVLCAVLLGFSMGGIAAATLSSNIEMHEMEVMNNQNGFVAKIMKFFDSTAGMIILVVSFASMIAGMWYKQKRRLISVAVVGAIFMFAGMYHFYSLWLQIAGIAIMSFTYLPMYSFKVSKLLKLG